MAISLFEDYLNQLYLSFNKASPIALTDIKGSGIERTKTYLRKAVAIRFPSDGNSWKKTLDALVIRNIVAHNGGHTDEV